MANRKKRLLREMRAEQERMIIGKVPMRWLAFCVIMFAGCNNPCKCVEQGCHMQPVIIDDMILFM